MGDDPLQRVEEKLDRLLERVALVEEQLSVLAARVSVRSTAGRRREIVSDPELERRFRERVDHIRGSGRLEEFERRSAQATNEHGGDRHWWLREMLDRADRDAPIKP
jgi:hypothetical protein